MRTKQEITKHLMELSRFANGNQEQELASLYNYPLLADEFEEWKERRAGLYDGYDYSQVAQLYIEAIG